MESEERLREKMLTLQRALKHKRIKVRYRDARTSIIEGIVSRGDERLKGLFEHLVGQGVRLEAWRECFRPDAYFEWFEGKGIDTQDFLKPRAESEVLPWDFIDTGVEKSFLRADLDRAEAGLGTADCYSGCADCGIGCGNKGSGVGTGSRKYPVVEEAEEAAPAVPLPARKYTFRYGKYGDARYIGNLDTMDLMLRTLRSAGISIKTHGRYHPMPNISLSAALPMGVESTSELMEVEVMETTPFTKGAMSAINAMLPKGMQIYEYIEGPLKDMVKESSYIMVADGARDIEGLQLIRTRQKFIYLWKGKSVKSLWQQGLFTRAIRVEDRRIHGSRTDH
jgi:radical SAM-linked protein